MWLKLPLGSATPASETVWLVEPHPAAARYPATPLKFPSAINRFDVWRRDTELFTFTGLLEQLRIYLIQASNVAWRSEVVVVTMLKARISRRESSSICAFCQHRLSLRLARPRNTRQFSGTRKIEGNGGWGGWAKQFGAPGPKQDDFLNQHELSARQKLIAKQAQEAPKPPAPKPTDQGVQARHVWDAGKQREVENWLRRDGVTLPNDIRSTSGFKRELNPNRRPVPLSFNSSNTKREEAPRQEPSPRNASNAASDLPGDLAGSLQPVNGRSPLTDNTIKPSRDSDPYSSFKKPWQSRFAGPQGGFGRRLPPQPGTDNSFRRSGDEADWNLLSRKPPPKSSNSEDFWSAVQGNMADREGAKSRGPGTAERAPRGYGSKDPWDNVLRGPGSSALKANSYDWGKEFGELPPRRKDRPISSTVQEERLKPDQASSEVSVDTEEQGQTQTQTPTQTDTGRDRDRGRDRRAARFELEGRGGTGRGKRSKRSSRSGDDDEDGFDYDEYQERRRLKAQRKRQREAESGPTPIRLPELISITALAEALKVEPNLFLTQLGELGFEGVTLDSLMAGETAALVAQEYGFEPTVEAGADRDLKPRPPPEDPSILPPRPPVVTIMGHVDHGKTTLLDYLRKSSIAAQEHGGITQRIGAFSVKLSTGKQITFLDTPGHAAFLTMRQRGAYVTDIVVLVVAADDSVKPQTIEAIKHARAAKVPMIVAINKIDKDGARIDQVKHDLATEGVEIEDFGGDVQVVCVSGKTGQGMDDLEENILTLSEILDHRAELDGPAEGWILESSLKPIGKAATVLVKRGTLRPGDYIAAGLTWAKIRHLRNEAGVDIDEAPPGTPVEILGWKDLPVAGDQVIQAPDESRAREAVEYREGLREREKDAAVYEEISEARKALQEKRAREKAAAETGEDGADSEALPEEENGTKMVNFVVKGDLHGSVEAVCAAIQELGNHEVRPRILRSGTGPIHEFDVEHAATSKSIIVNFATTTPGYIKNMAEEQGVKILEHNVIYHLVDDVKAKLSEHLEPEVTSRVLGEAEVLQIFPINIKGRTYKNVAGCRVRNGVIARNNLFRVYRGGEKIFDGKLETLKHLKKDITEVRKGTECGIGLEEFQDFQVGDQIQAYEEVKTKRSL
ncbi:initiation factor 2 [Hypoxylon sp. FL0543]|nr:initiation factor 2 [Hypoxylon sp. FL0543]